MQIELFEQIKTVLKQNGWQYYLENDIWTTEVKTFNGVLLANSALISIMDTDSASSIALFFTYVLKKPDVLGEIFGLLPDSFFEIDEFQA